MNLLRNYYDEDNVQRTALIIKQGHKWMTVLLVRAGRLTLVRRPLTDEQYMTPLVGNYRKATASVRRLARKPGTPRKVRDAVRAAL